MRARVNQVDIAYDDHGIGQPVIFLHAFPLNRNMWSDVTTALLQEKRFRLVAPDWRGFGESEINGEQFTMELLADDVAALMDTLGMQQAVLCGLSMGGYAAFAFLRKYPERVGGLILSDTRPDADTQEGKANREKVAQLAEQQGSEAIADFQLPRVISDYTRQHHPEIEARIRHMIYAATPTGIAAASRGMGLRPDSTDLLARIACPTLVIVGEHDGPVPPDVAREYAAKIPGARFAMILEAGHVSNLEQPEAFLKAVREFLLTHY
ncbi:alpha/beta hydrolase [Reticulibacter mediterranei]|uniref:Alpha/beta hydrolase n=1 Tax=Reticulibacter mediterranei TaxID=2778369 RepID=A0A8J3N4Q4_9CHLR|nr:alpha/beta fold hydrolase [Reticulibacter mediterranei]GHO95708.1 alpha/beta hydrolase [Reticulibacter mediterranei]